MPAPYIYNYSKQLIHRRKGFYLEEKGLHYAKVRRKVFSSKEKYLHYAKVRRKGEEKDLIS